jgi:hypothetical protein
MFLIITQLAFAQGRKPAVEDFVGIEVDQPEGTPQGTEGLFNFEKAIDKFEHTKDSPSGIAPVVNTKTQDPSDLTTALVIAFMLGLPGMIWFFMMSNLRQKAKIESASNIEVLEKYRRERQEAKKAEEAFKKSA